MEKLDKVIAGDLISRSALLAKVEWEESYMGTNGTEYVLVNYVREAPAVEAEPVVHAHWEKRYVPAHARSEYFCTACGHPQLRESKRCPECGAHMDEEVADA